MEIKEIKELMADLEGSKFSKIVIKKGDFELHLEKEPSCSPAVHRQVVVESHAAPPLPSSAGPAAHAGTYVTSPMVGTYYSASAPDQSPFIKVGEHVSEHTVVCIIEAMKVLNEVKAGQSGVVAEILAENAQPVEFGTRLLRIV